MDKIILNAMHFLDGVVICSVTYLVIKSIVTHLRHKTPLSKVLSETIKSHIAITKILLILIVSRVALMIYINIDFTNLQLNADAPFMKHSSSHTTDSNIDKQNKPSQNQSNSGLQTGNISAGRDVYVIQSPPNQFKQNHVIKKSPTQYAKPSQTTPVNVNEIDKASIDKMIKAQYLSFSKTINNGSENLSSDAVINNLYDKFYYKGHICNKNSYQQLRNFILSLGGWKVEFYLEEIVEKSIQKEEKLWRVKVRGRYSLSGQFPGEEKSTEYIQTLTSSNGTEWLFCGWE